VIRLIYGNALAGIERSRTTRVRAPTTPTSDHPQRLWTEARESRSDHPRIFLKKKTEKRSDQKQLATFRPSTIPQRLWSAVRNRDVNRDHPVDHPTIDHRERLWDRGARSRSAHLRIFSKKSDLTGSSATSVGRLASVPRGRDHERDPGIATVGPGSPPDRGDTWLVKVTRSARAVEWVVRIGRKAIEPDVTTIATQLNLPLRRPMARLA
jgi:hypothetical protein